MCDLPLEVTANVPVATVRGVPIYPAASPLPTGQDECLQLMREAIEFHLEGMRAHGEIVPAPNTVAVTTFTTAA